LIKILVKKQLNILESLKKICQLLEFLSVKKMIF